MRASSALILILGVGSLGTAVHAETPTIGFISPDIITEIGGEVELTCSITNGQEYPIFWARLNDQGNAFPISSGPSLLVKDSRFSLDHELGQRTYTLSIKSVQPSDAATYQCQVLVGLHDMITADVKVQAKLPPSMTDRGSSPHVVGTSGKSVTMECIAEGFPAPKMVWTREDRRLMHTGKTQITTHKLTIPNLRKADRGGYVCTASNGVGKSDSRTLDLAVEFEPEVAVPSPRVAQAPGYDVELACRFTAYPPPAIYWRRYNQTILDSDTKIITHFATQDEETISTLKISEVTEDDYGNYTCEAINRFGSAASIVELNRSKIPICPPVCGQFDLAVAPHSSGNTERFTASGKLLLILAQLCGYLHFNH